MGQSLNSWAMEDESKVCEGENIPPAELEIHNELSEHERLMNAMENLEVLQEEIIAAGGMNKGFALEAMRFAPELGKTPVGFYTEGLSATRYKTALEEMSMSIKAMIVAGIMVLIGIIYKIISWMFGDSSSDSNNNSGSKNNPKDLVPATIEAVETIKEVVKGKEGFLVDLQDGVADIRNVLSAQPLDADDGHGHHAVIKSLDDAIAYSTKAHFDSKGEKSPAARLEELQTAMLDDVIKHGPLTKNILSFARDIEAVIAVIDERVNAAKDLLAGAAKLDDRRNQTHGYIERDKDNVASAAALFLESEGTKRRIQTLEGQIEVQFEGKKTKLKDVSFRFSEMYHNVEVAHGSRKLTASELIHELLAVYKSDDWTNLIEHNVAVNTQMVRIEEAMSQLEAAVPKASDTTSSGSLGSNMGTILRAAMRSISDDLVSVKAITVILSHYFASVSRAINEAEGALSVSILHSILFVKTHTTTEEYKKRHAELGVEPPDYSKYTELFDEVMHLAHDIGHTQFVNTGSIVAAARATDKNFQRTNKSKKKGSRISPGGKTPK